MSAADTGTRCCDQVHRDKSESAGFEPDFVSNYTAPNDLPSYESPFCAKSIGEV